MMQIEERRNHMILPSSDRGTWVTRVSSTTLSHAIQHTSRDLVGNNTQCHIPGGPLPATQCELGLRDIGNTRSF